MPIQYLVKPGDYLASIAKAHGYTDWRAIWNDPGNAKLRQLRGNPNVLYAGDEVSIPDLAVKKVDAPTDQRHRYTVSRVPLGLALALLDEQRKPIANTPCRLTIDGETTQVTTDGDGLIKRAIPHDSKTGSVAFKPSDVDAVERTIPLAIGHLDPIDTVDGQCQRLDNLGYFAGPFEGRDPAGNAEAFESAVEEFQCDNKLAVDGDCGAATQARLKQVHGC